MSQMVIDDVLRDELDTDHVQIRLVVRVEGIKKDKVKKQEQRGWFVAKDTNWDVQGVEFKPTFWVTLTQR